MFLLTWHGHLVAIDVNLNRILQVGIFSNDERPLLELDLTETTAEENLEDKVLIAKINNNLLSSKYSHFDVQKSESSMLINLKFRGKLLCAEPSGAIAEDRTTPGIWEHFFAINAKELALLKRAKSLSILFNGQFLSSNEIDIQSGFKLRLGNSSIDLTEFLTSAATDTTPSGPAGQDLTAARTTKGRLLAFESAPFINASIASEKNDLQDIAQAISLGFIRDAREKFEKFSSINPSQTEGLDALKLRRHLQPYNPKNSEKPPSLIWRSNASWERDWLHMLLPPTSLIENERAAAALNNQTVFVVDSNLKPKDRNFYADLLRRNCHIILIHLSDEAYLDDYDIYNYCGTVFRNYWSPILVDSSHVFSFALGYKSGFADEVPPPPLDLRELMWSFAGDPNKSSRAKMLDSMRNVGRGMEHLTLGFGSADTLSVADYRNVMIKSKFIPCPSGWINLDSFRVYEALEAGCIPIVERRPNFNYFKSALKDCPFPTVEDWSEAEMLIPQMSPDHLCALGSNCQEWWRRYKAKLKSHMRAVSMVG